jgi:uncharacterized SAM-binding protein YcdF (DUF218 family)
VTFLVLLGILGGFLLLHRPLLAGYAELFHVDDPVKSDLIVLLLGGPDHRPNRAAQLYLEGYAPKVAFCDSGEVVGSFARETEVTAGLLEKKGVPRSDLVLLPDKVASTRDEAIAVRRYLQAHPMRRILIVTSNFHSRRALWIFQKTLRDTHVEVHAASTPHPGIDRPDWYWHDESALGYLIEGVKTLVYWIRF